MSTKKQHKKHHAKKHHPRKKAHLRKKKSSMHYVRVFFLYVIALGALAAWIDVTSYGVFDPILLTLATLGISVVATLLHWLSGRHDRFDDVADGDL